MSHITLRPRFSVELSHEELRLVTMALTGVLPESERAAAHTLGLRLLEQRSREMQELLAVYDGALERARELTPPGDEP